MRQSRFAMDEIHLEALKGYLCQRRDAKTKKVPGIARRYLECSNDIRNTDTYMSIEPFEMVNSQSVFWYDLNTLLIVFGTRLYRCWENI